MTKKDYKLIADLVSRFRQTSTVNNQQIDPLQVENLVDMFCLDLQRENQRFDEQKFRRACGV